MQDLPPTSGRFPRLLAAVCAGFLIVWIVMASLTPIVEADEARYVQVAREMTSGGHWLALRLHGESYDQKPPLPFWMIGAALKATGGELREWAVRLPSILLGVLTVGMCGWIGSRRLGHDAGICAALMLGSLVQFLGDAPKVELNVPLTFWTTLAVAFWMTRRKDHRLSRWRAIGMWSALFLAIMTKGPLALVVVGAALIGDALDRGGARRLLLARPAWGMAGLVAGLLGYLGALAAANGIGFVEGMLHDALVHRVLEGDHAAPAHFYVVKLLTSILFPWSPLLIAIVWHAWRARQGQPFRGGLAFVGWTLVPLIVLSLAHGKRESYAVPLLPGFALLFAWFLFGTEEALKESRAILLANLGRHGAVIPGSRRSVAAVAAVTVLLAVVGEGTVVRAEALKDSPRRFGALLDHFVLRHASSSVIGAFEKGDGCEYYTYSGVQVRELEIAGPEDVDPSDWPDVIAGRKSDWRKFADTAILNGYVPVLSQDAAGERIHVWAREPGSSRLPRVAIDVLQEEPDAATDAPARPTPPTP